MNRGYGKSSSNRSHPYRSDHGKDDRDRRDDRDRKNRNNVNTALSDILHDPACTCIDCRRKARLARKDVTTENASSSAQVTVSENAPNRLEHDFTMLKAELAALKARVRVLERERGIECPPTPGSGDVTDQPSTSTAD